MIKGRSNKKFCSGCQLEKDWNDFSFDKQMKDSKSFYCKKCQKDRHHKYYLEHKEKILNKTKDYRLGDPVKEKIRAKRYRSTFNGRFADLKGRMKRLQKKGLASTLTYEEFLSFRGKPCIYCNENLATICLDRIDNSKGYAMANCNPCCFTCNKAKSLMSLEGFKNWVTRVFTVLCVPDIPMVGEQ